MKDKVILITGSSSGIGKATALRFAKLDAKLILHGTNPSRLKAVADICEEVSPRKLKQPFTATADFANLDDVKKLAIYVKDNYANLDIIINNAGLYKNSTILSPQSTDDFVTLMNINFISVVQLTSALVPCMLRNKGCIINVSSNLAFKPMGGTSAYSSSKAALTAFTKSIAIELAPNIRAVSISPGPVATLMSTRSGMDVEVFRKVVGNSCLSERVGEADEIARTIVFIASPESEFITGTDIVIDGGSSIKPSGKVMGS